jgi:hypothetical protein
MKFIGDASVRQQKPFATHELIISDETASRMALGLTQPAIQSVPGALSLEVKHPEREADHSPPPSAKVKE